MNAQSRRALAKAKNEERDADFEELRRILSKIRDTWPGSWDRGEQLFEELNPHDRSHSVLTDNANVGNTNAKKSASSKPKAASVKHDVSASQSNESRKRAASVPVQLANAVAAKKIKSM
ncbi:hypothetical protein SLS55_005854 [Diplodia seriata]|uniref:Uncharacterized protein n=1 Tax=Diplodia seriata TaxID=420778 RepID=A0ABR3CKZ2_9PEZI